MILMENEELNNINDQSESHVSDFSMDKTRIIWCLIDRPESPLDFYQNYGLKINVLQFVSLFNQHFWNFSTAFMRIELKISVF